AGVVGRLVGFAARKGAAVSGWGLMAAMVARCGAATAAAEYAITPALIASPQHPAIHPSWRGLLTLSCTVQLPGPVRRPRTPKDARPCKLTDRRAPSPRRSAKPRGAAVRGPAAHSRQPLVTIGGLA